MKKIIQESFVAKTAMENCYNPQENTLASSNATAKDYRKKRESSYVKALIANILMIISFLLYLIFPTAWKLSCVGIVWHGILMLFSLWWAVSCYIKPNNPPYTKSTMSVMSFGIIVEIFLMVSFDLYFIIKAFNKDPEGMTMALLIGFIPLGLIRILALIPAFAALVLSWVAKISLSRIPDNEEENIYPSAENN